MADGHAPPPVGFAPHSLVPTFIPLCLPLPSATAPASSAPSLPHTPPLAEHASREVEASGAVAERRYGGAIVRISDLVARGGGAGHARAVAYNDGPHRGAEAAHAPRAPQSEAVSYEPMPTLASGRGRAARRGRRGDSRAEAATRRGAGRRRTLRRSTRGADANLLRSDGTLYEHRWMTVRGRRQLVYNGRTYKGRSAHVMWRRLKSASERPLAPPTPPSTPRRRATATAPTTGFQTAAELYRNIELETSPATETPSRRRAVAPPTRIPRKQPLRPTALHLLQTVAPHPTPAAKVNDKTARPAPSAAGTAVPRYFDSDTTSSLDDLDSNSSSFSSDAAPTSSAACPDDGSVVEHDGWVYPAAVYAEVMQARRDEKAHKAERVTPTQTPQQRRRRRESAADDEVPLAVLCGVADNIASSAAPRAAGVQVIGCQTAQSRPRTTDRASRQDTALVPLPSVYNSDDVFDGLASQEAEDLFEVAEELGGVRYAGV